MNNFVIAFNDTLESRLLVSSMITDIEFIKYPSITKPVEEDFKQIFYNTLFHGLIAKNDTLPDILSPNFKEDLDLDRTRFFLNYSQSPWISIHIGDNLKDLSDDECIINAKKNIQYIRENISNDRLHYIALENMELGSNLNTLKPDFITRLIKETGCKLLLDTAHATIAAHLLNMDVFEYVSKLPLNDLVEIHFSGTAKEKDTIYSHIRAREKDYELLEYILSKKTPYVVTLEYGLYDKVYKSGFLNNMQKVSYSKINIEALNEILYMYYRVNKLRKHSF